VRSELDLVAPQPGVDLGGEHCETFSEGRRAAGCEREIEQLVGRSDDRRVAAECLHDVIGRPEHDVRLDQVLLNRLGVSALGWLVMIGAALLESCGGDLDRLPAR